MPATSRSRVAAAWRVSLVRLAIAQAVLIGAVTLVMVRLSMAAPLAKTADWIKRIGLDGGTVSAGLPNVHLRPWFKRSCTWRKV